MFTNTFSGRIARVRAEMAARDVDVLLLSTGPDLPWLIGYEAMGLERLTMFVLPLEGDPHLVIPRLETARVGERPDVYGVVPWDETDNPIAIVADLAGNARRAAVGNHTLSMFTIRLLDQMEGVRFVNGSEVVGPLRAVKTPDEIEALRNAAHAADRVIGRIQSGELNIVGRTEAEVSAEIGHHLVDEGHHHMNFGIVAAGENAASPHHHPGSTVITPGRSVLFDIGGTMYTDDGVGYCSDITRNVWLGTPDAEYLDMYAVLLEAQQAQVEAAVVGATCESVDRVGRQILADANLGQYFMHRTGHGIGVEAHEDPYLVEGNETPLIAGHAFSIEPGVYIEGRFGARIEDIVVAADAGPDVLAQSDHALAVLDV